jgi:hypothetical protein
MLKKLSCALLMGLAVVGCAPMAAQVAMEVEAEEVCDPAKVVFEAADGCVVVENDNTFMQGTTGISEPKKDWLKP